MNELLPIDSRLNNCNTVVREFLIGLLFSVLHLRYTSIEKLVFSSQSAKRSALLVQLTPQPQTSDLLLPKHHYQSPNMLPIHRKLLVRPQPLHILIPQTYRDGNLPVRRPRHQVDQAFDRLELRSPHRLRLAQPEPEIEIVTLYFRP